MAYMAVTVTKYVQGVSADVYSERVEITEYVHGV
jgi:hypothetical protein